MEICNREIPDFMFEKPERKFIASHLNIIIFLIWLFYSNSNENNSNMKSTSYLTFFLVLFIVLFYGCKSSSTGSTDKGKPWLTFTKASSSNMLDDNIHAILIAQGQVYFGTDSGVVQYQSGVWATFARDSFAYTVNSSGHSSTAWKINAIAQAYDASLWFGMYGGGVRRYNQISSSAAWQKYTFADATITGIAASSSDRGSVWVSTTLGAYEYIFPDAPELPTNGHFVQPPSTSGVQSSYCYVDVSPVTGNIYFGTNSARIAYLNVDNNTWYNRALRAGYDSPITGISVDYSGTIWCGKQTGVTFYNPAQDTMFDFTPDNTGGKLPAATVNAVGTDFFYKTRWFGTNYGLAQLKDTTWTLFNTTNTSALPSDKIQALAYDLVKKNLWIGTDKGIVVYNESGVTLK